MTSTVPRSRAWGAAARAAEVVAAEGTLPRRLAAVVAWIARPGRSADALRRAVRDATAGLSLPGLLVAPDGPDAGVPAAMAGDDPRGPGEALDEASADAPPGAGVSREDRARMDALLDARLVAADLCEAEEILRAWARLGARAAVVGDAGYPSAVAEGWPATDGPPLLVWRGAPPVARHAVAVVGARGATLYGTGVAAWLAQAVADVGVRVVSGGAVGIDAAAHGAALDRPGGTTVVLGCGHGVAYPRAHAAPGGLFSRVLAAGGTLVGELLPHERPHAGRVRARNRIVAALAGATVVIEGGARSGALLTASAAAERGRAVLAVPGDVRAPGSVAPHRLLAEGAAPCTSPADLLAALGVTFAPRGGAATVGGPGGTDAGQGDAGAGADPAAGVLPASVHAVLARAWPRPLRVDELASAAAIGVPSLLAALTRARVAGVLAEGPDGLRLCRAPR